MQNRLTRLSVALVALLLAAVMLPMAAGKAEALASDLFFSEYIEGSSNNKALEIYNATGAAVDLAAGGYNVQMYFNGGISAGLTISLTGTVASGDVFVLAHSSANATILAQADQTNGAGWFNGDDAVMLVKGAANDCRRHRSGWGRPRHRMGNGSHQHRRQHAATEGFGLRRGHQRGGHLRSLRRVGRVCHGHLRRAGGALVDLRPQTARDQRVRGGPCRT